MKILGIAAPFGHDASAALIVDGKVVAAAEEERFTRVKHAESQKPVNSIKFCLEAAGLKPSDIDIVAYPWSYQALKDKRAEHFFRTIVNRPSRAYKKFFRNEKELRNQNNFVETTLKESGFDIEKTKVEWIEHHLSHMASSFYFSGMKEAAVMSIDAGGEIASTVIGFARNGKIEKIKEILSPDSLGEFYATMTDYLGFRRGNGEYKVMGMAPFGNPDEVEFDDVIWWNKRKKTYRCSDDFVWVQRSKRFRKDKVYSKKMVNRFGKQRKGDALDEPYIHIAAATQKKLEEITLKLVDTYLADELKKHGNLCFSGGCALNVVLNRILLKHPLIKNLYVQPASHDAGTSLGAAVVVAANYSDAIEPMNHAYYGPEYSNEEIEKVLRDSGYNYSKEIDIAQKSADLLDRGEIVAWFQGKMEWGPRALGNRSILGNPAMKGTADTINAMIKFREKWRPFCPSILKEYGKDILGSDQRAEFMAIAFDVNDYWKQKIPEVVHVNGTCRPQLVDKDTNPLYYKLIENFYKRTQTPVVINTSLNRRGEPMVCSPKDAVEMFKGSGLKYMAIGDFLVKKDDSFDIADIDESYYHNILKERKNKEKINKALFVRTDRLGEFLLSLYSIKKFKQEYPDTEVYLLASKNNIELVRNVDFIDYFLEYDHDCFSGIIGGFRLAKLLKKEKIDCIVVMNPNKVVHIASFLAQLPLRVGYNRKAAVCLNRKIEDLKSKAVKHEVEYNLDLVGLLCSDKKVPRIDLVVDEHISLEAIKNEIDISKKYCVIHPFSSYPKKKVDEGFWFDFVDKMRKSGNDNIVMIGSNQERQESLELADKLKINNLVGKLSLRQLATFLKYNCSAFVGLDSGPMHLASILNIPVVGLFKVFSPTRWGPFTKNSLVVSASEDDAFLEQCGRIINFISKHKL